MIMTSIRRVRKAFKRKYGLKCISFCVQKKSQRIQITPTVQKRFREELTKLMKKSKSLSEYICTLTGTKEV